MRIIIEIDCKDTETATIHTTTGTITYPHGVTASSLPPPAETLRAAAALGASSAGAAPAEGRASGGPFADSSTAGGAKPAATDAGPAPGS